MSRLTKKIIWMIVDSFILLTSGYLSYLFLSPMIWLNQRSMFFHILSNIAIYLLVANLFKVYQKINRYTSVKETLSHFLAVTLTFLISSTIYYMRYEINSLRFTALTYLIAAMVLPGLRIIWRLIVEHMDRERRFANTHVHPIKTLVVGAGEGGSLFIRHMKNEPEMDIIGIVDENVDKLHTKVFGVEVLGTFEDIDKIIKQYNVDQVTVAIPSLAKKDLERVLEHTGAANVKVNQMPSVENVISGNYEVNEMKEIGVMDLLGRSEVKLDTKQISDKIINQTILVTGAGGSIGSEITRQIMEFIPKRILLLGQDEFAIYTIHQEMLKHRYADRVDLVPIIGDIKDRERMFEVMERYQPSVVYHAAAHKHVPLMEYNPREAVKNNVYGTKNVAEAAKANGVKSFVMISTDKAVNPTNVMGATKRMAEMIVTSLNDETCETTFSAVRFGNVLGSSGSVVPLFKRQIANGGPVTVTDFRMTRYFMTIPEASRLVIQAGALARGGEIFVLDMGERVRIYDLAKKMISLSGKQGKVEIVESGIRPGEKLYEEMLTNTEQVSNQVFEKIFIGNVTHVPLETVMDFAAKLLKMPEPELRKEIVKFANEH
ncbi:polysaccharide biosynthesis protein [Allofustis seminis]|uniref:polysaccharide biosynthesis protein n=1 Tax=Allofustis seminis TaxID=166939 RepID=UPI0003736CF5|nr:nucleoside-diphosphate sugar epimerase/dehydratase [Allofustis seminis]